MNNKKLLKKFKRLSKKKKEKLRAVLSVNVNPGPEILQELSVSTRLSVEFIRRWFLEAQYPSWQREEYLKEKNRERELTEAKEKKEWDQWANRVNDHVKMVEEQRELWEEAQRILQKQQREEMLQELEKQKCFQKLQQVHQEEAPKRVEENRFPKIDMSRLDEVQKKKVYLLLDDMGVGEHEELTLEEIEHFLDDASEVLEGVEMEM